MKAWRVDVTWPLHRIGGHGELGLEMRQPVIEFCWDLLLSTAQALLPIFWLSLVLF